MNVEIDIETLVTELRRNPESIMDALASFAEADERMDDKLLTWIAEADCGSTYHSRVGPWLRRLADALEQNA
jgi:hypothetical protein